MDLQGIQDPERDTRNLVKGVSIAKGGRSRY
jgi:hypothetical protein